MRVTWTVPGVSCLVPLSLLVQLDAGKKRHKALNGTVLWNGTVLLRIHNTKQQQAAVGILQHMCGATCSVLVTYYMHMVGLQTVTTPLVPSVAACHNSLILPDAAYHIIYCHSVKFVIRVT